MGDYTNETPFDENPDDFLIGNLASAADKSVEEIEKDNRFLAVPPGEQVLVVAGFFGAPESGYHRVFVDGKLTGFEAYAVTVKLALASNPKATITDRFVLPPSDPNNARAYFYGVPEDRKNEGKASKMAPGILGNRFSHFINRLGFAWAPGQPFPVQAQKLGNWKGRPIVANIKAGFGTYPAKDGTQKPRDNSIEWFSYKLYTGTQVDAGPPTNGHDRASAPSSPGKQAATANAANGRHAQLAAIGGDVI